jgi:hypothetical protein
MLKFEYRLSSALLVLLLTSCKAPVDLPSSESSWRKVSFTHTETRNGIAFIDTNQWGAENYHEVVHISGDSLYICQGETTMGSTTTGVAGRFLASNDTLWPMDSNGNRITSVFMRQQSDTLFRNDVRPDVYDSANGYWIRDIGAVHKYVPCSCSFPPSDWGPLDLNPF